MCTNIAERAAITGVGKGTAGWFAVDRVNVMFDHPFQLDAEHALCLDFVNEAMGPGARVAVELTTESARRLVETIQVALERGRDA